MVRHRPSPSYSRAVVVTGYRIQPLVGPGIEEMGDAITDATGYEGMDEYVPRADATN
jgi:hypothetical protein